MSATGTSRKLIEGYTIQGSASLGIAIYPEDGNTRDTLLKTADVAMYTAKNSGRRKDFRTSASSLDPNLVPDDSK
jgi:GGDEF domain-containing protein